MNAEGYDVTRPINDWCADSSIPSGTPLVCADGTTNYGPRWAESWDDWGPFYTPMYSQLVGLNGSTVEMCNQVPTAGTPPQPIPVGPPTVCGPGTTTYEKVGRSGARRHQYITVWSTLLFDTDNRVELMERPARDLQPRRGRCGAASAFELPAAPDRRHEAVPEPRDLLDGRVPEGVRDPARAIISGAISRPGGSSAGCSPTGSRCGNSRRATRLRRRCVSSRTRGGQRGAVVWMDQPLRGLAYTSLAAGRTCRTASASSTPRREHGATASCGAPTSWTIPDAADLQAEDGAGSEGLERTAVESTVGETPSTFSLEIDSPTAVRTLNACSPTGSPLSWRRCRSRRLR